MDHTIGEDTTTHTRPQGDHHEIMHAARTAEGMLTQCYHLRIISHRHRHSQTVAHHRPYRDDTFPGHVG